MSDSGGYIGEGYDNDRREIAELMWRLPGTTVSALLEELRARFPEKQRPLPPHLRPGSGS